MSIPVPTTITTGTSGTGIAYWRERDLVLLTDSSSTSISAVDMKTHTVTIVGTGYNALHDIELSSDGVHAYVVEVNGRLLRVPLNNLNRSAATIVAENLGPGGMSQIALDEKRGCAYICTGGPTTQFLKIDLATGAVTVLAKGFALVRGLLAGKDGLSVYFSIDGNEIERYDTNTGWPWKTTLSTWLKGPRKMVWANDNETTIYLVQNGPPAVMMKIDLTAPRISPVQIAGPFSDTPYCLTMIAPDHLVVGCMHSVCEVNFPPADNSTVPILLAVGPVPVDTIHLPEGYADTSIDPACTYHARKAPFRGTLPIMINHDQARALGANYYQIQIGPLSGVPEAVRRKFHNYLWNKTNPRFDLVTIDPEAGFYKVHAQGELWLDPQIGTYLDTLSQPNELRRLSVRLFGSRDMPSEIGSAGDPGRSVTLMIDNSIPFVHVE
jgi:hypothetical protein